MEVRSAEAERATPLVGNKPAAKEEGWGGGEGKKGCFFGSVKKHLPSE